MVDLAYHFCPQCGTPLHIKKEGKIELQICERDHVLYKNQNACVSGVIIVDGSMLLVRRAREPRKGFLDFPGGFVEPDEHPEQAMAREINEELSLETTRMRLLGVYGPDPYIYQGVHNYNLGITYRVEVVPGVPKPADDV